MALGKRIRELRESARLSRAELARLAGISATSVQRIEDEQQEPSVSVALALARALRVKIPDFLSRELSDKVPRGWTLDELQYALGKASEALDALRDGGSGPRSAESSIPLISRASAGKGEIFTDQGYPAGAAEEYIERPPGLKDSNAYALKVDGESMAPQLMPGWVVIVSPEATYTSGDICVVKDLENEVWIKRLLVRKDHYLLQSMNPEFEPVSLSKEQVRFIHKVVWIKPK